MEYAYVICPKCWDRLIKVEDIENLDSYEQKRCLKCNTRFGLALLGEKEMDDSMYRVILKYKTKLDEIRESDIRNTMQSMNLDADAVMKAIDVGDQGSLIYEGDIIHTYLLKKVFTG